MAASCTATALSAPPCSPSFFSRGTSSSTSFATCHTSNHATCLLPSSSRSHSSLSLLSLFKKRASYFSSSPSSKRGSRAASASSSEEAPPSALNSPPPPSPPAVGGAAGENPSSLSSEKPLQRRRQAAQSTDWVASSLTRRFGIGAGLAWVGVLGFGVVSEQIKTRTEVYLEQRDTREVENGQEIVTPEGVRYTDIRIGGGSFPSKGDLVLVSLLGKVEGEDVPFVDTYSPGKKDIVFTFGARPYIGGVCYGLEIAMKTMKVGGKRKVVVPPALGFGVDGADFGGVKVPGDAELGYVVDLQRASIPPS